MSTSGVQGWNHAGGDDTSNKAPAGELIEIERFGDSAGVQAFLNLLSFLLSLCATVRAIYKAE